MPSLLRKASSFLGKTTKVLSGVVNTIANPASLLTQAGTLATALTRKPVGSTTVPNGNDLPRELMRPGGMSLPTSRANVPDAAAQGFGQAVGQRVWDTIGTFFGGSSHNAPGSSVANMPAAVVQPVYEQRPIAPPGYVLVRTGRDAQGRPVYVAMLKPLAYAYGFRKRPHRGGGISSADIRKARKVQRTITSLTVHRQPRVQIKRAGRKR